MPDTLSIDDSGRLSIDVVEYVNNNIRNNFKNVKEINEKIEGDKTIVIEYLDPTGVSVRREVYEDVEYIGERYGGCNYDDDTKLITTSLVFKYKTRRDASTN